MSTKALNHIFNPKKIAVIGATSKPDRVGFAVFRNLITTGFQGTVYPVNIKRESVQGVKAYKSVNDIPDSIDLALIATPAQTVPDLINECAEAKVKGVVILSGGFNEAGALGEMMSKQIMERAKAAGIRIIGPNCLGFIKPKLALNASFGPKMALPGNIAFISQSGALGTAILDWSVKHNVGFSNFISIGSMIDVSFHDLIDYFGQDSETQSILIYMESLKHARKFMSAARAFARNKPIIVLKVGKSEAGSKAAKSHTGSITGNDAAFNAAFERAGIVRVNSVEELFDVAQTLSMQKRPKGNKLCIITNAGGPGVLATDELIEKNGRLADLTKETMDELNKVLPANWSKGNPVDIIGDADPQRYAQAVRICTKDPNVDGLLVILTPQSMTHPSHVAHELVKLAHHSDEPILAAWMGEDDVQEGREILKTGSIPAYYTPERAVRTFMNIYSYSHNLQTLYETPATIPHAFKPNTDANHKLIEHLYQGSRFVMTEGEAKEFLSNYGIPVSKREIVNTPEDAMNAAEKIGFPVAMKVVSQDILHKTDAGGVKLNIKTREDAQKAFNDIKWLCQEWKPDAHIEGVLIEPMVSKRYELLIGAKRDPIFGPLIVFGMGGVSVEIFKDTNIGLPPLNMALAMRIIEDTKIYKLLKGFRGIPAVDIESIQFLLYKFAYLLADFPQIKELDINPFAVDEHGGIVLDAKVVLEEHYKKSQHPYAHLVISPYPKEYVQEYKMNDKRTAILRPIRPEDEPMEAEMFTKFSEETQRFRFFELVNEVNHEMLVRYTQNDYDREIAIIAEVDENWKKNMAGVVRLIADADNETAEFAIVVADPWQHLGLGSKMTDYILEIAKERGIKKVYAEVLTDNKIMLHMLKKRGFNLEEQDDTVHCELDIN